VTWITFDVTIVINDVLNVLCKLSLLVIGRANSINGWWFTAQQTSIPY